MAKAILLDGREDADDLRDRVAERVRALRDSRKLRPGLALIRIGDKGETKPMLDERERWARDAGFQVNRHDMPAETTTEELLLVVEGINDDSAINGVVILEPAPKQIDMGRVRRAVLPVKDVDGQHPLNAGELMTGGVGLVPSIPLAVRAVLRNHHGRGLAGMTAAVLGRCATVGAPVAQLLIAADCTVTVAHSQTRDPKAVARAADIVVCAVNRAEAVRSDWIQAGATVIDTGRHRLQQSGSEPRLVGDCRREEILGVAGAFADRFGAVGPLGIAMLLRNTLLACCRQHRIDLKVADCGV
ncbi:bifunctional 5,10-methylenetetrahydrofolate dehydrogenase/5,10-methenyltetrahydrofolate cyclohydrolase [Caenispirillum bisanense]|uniref:Bifunctional protein FolD n=1 Tax=Caenispirillum bisanense TaxID=414052 RepID=A0A286G7Y2_9PROT|nr:tetrahydrofolate dehydrogenase/cyclohydrolase catalytic domain-containing protein [Caenispirillum bisanense]SOD91623.1 methylenetetrahydrofolate dehydrogenase (NADP+) / methenyltetrahydrofolate cyclohydrolase [Caenispirillum bisanense]